MKKRYDLFEIFAPLAIPAVAPRSAGAHDNHQVEVSSVTWRDWDTGQESNFAGVNCDAFYYGGAGAAATATATSTATLSSACVLGGTAGETIASGVGVEEGCKNALASVCYTVRRAVSDDFSLAAVSSYLRR